MSRKPAPIFCTSFLSKNRHIRIHSKTFCHKNVPKKKIEMAIKWKIQMELLILCKLDLKKKHSKYNQWETFLV